MDRRYWRCVAVLAAALAVVSPVAVVPAVQAQQNGEARSVVATVVREDYDMERFMAPIPLTETEMQGRQIFARRCANCHGATDRRPGPLLGLETIERRGEPYVREHIGTGSPLMPGFAYNLDTAEIDAIIAFMKTMPSPSAGNSQTTESPD